MIYLTVGDPYSGVISSQVVDVCTYIQRTFSVKVRLIAIISIRDFFAQRQKFRAAYPGAWVLPMVPQLKNWRINIFIIWLSILFSGDRRVISRGVLATNLALVLKKRGFLTSVCFDARGAYAAEWKEYCVVNDKTLISEVGTLEKQAVQSSDMRLAISQKLVDFWRMEYEYTGCKHVVIPCTLAPPFDQPFSNEVRLLDDRISLGYAADDIILVYAGSSAQWQSFEMFDGIVYDLLATNPRYKLLLLTDTDPSYLGSFQDFATQTRTMHVPFEKVRNILSICDYGILIRENSVTNQVAAPTKFAEYLSSGLKVLISDTVGDYTAFTIAHDCGRVIKGDATGVPEPLLAVPYMEKKRLSQIGLTYFSKSHFINNFQALV